MKKLFTLVCLSVIFAGCSQSSDSKSESKPVTPGATETKIETKSETFGYEMNFYGCETGKQQFNSLAELCKGLQDDALNHDCARDMREEYFKAQCQGAQKKSAGEITGPKAAELRARDKLVDDTLIRTLQPGNLTIMLYKNPNSESANVMVSCVSNAKAAVDSLNDSVMGGIILTTGAKIVLKNDRNRSFLDGTNFKATYLQIECQ